MARWSTHQAPQWPCIVNGKCCLKQSWTETSCISPMLMSLQDSPLAQYSVASSFLQGSVEDF